MKVYSFNKLLLLSSALVENAVGFFFPTFSPRFDDRRMMMSADIKMQQPSSVVSSISTRRQWYQQCSVAVAGVAMTTFPRSAAAERLVEYQGENNGGASKSRRADNSNVVFVQDHYYIFGTAPPFIPPGDMSYPEKMPFVPSKQRIETLVKYRPRVQRGIDLLASLQGEIAAGNYKSILGGEAPEYSIRPFGLLAAGFLGSETTVNNELYLARWYINEIFLDINDIKTAPSKDAALASHANAIKAVNSLLGMLNRSITSKVGDPFVLVGVGSVIQIDDN